MWRGVRWPGIASMPTSCSSAPRRSISRSTEITERHADGGRHLRSAPRTSAVRAFAIIDGEGQRFDEIAVDAIEFPDLVEEVDVLVRFERGEISLGARAQRRIRKPRDDERRAEVQ